MPPLGVKNCSPNGKDSSLLLMEEKEREKSVSLGV